MLKKYKSNKFIKCVISMALSMILAAASFGNSVFADSIQIGEELSASTSLYIRTSDCPDGYISYAKENIGRHLASVDPNELPKEGIFTVGNSFCFGNSDSDIYYFPVLCDNDSI